MQKSKILFVTVGTTQFDDLLNIIDTQNFLILCQKYGYNQLIIQKGRGNFQPKNLISQQDTIQQNQLDIEVYDFKAKYIEDFEKADLILSHCGAGTILDALLKNKKICTVINNKLMDNHQTDIYFKLLSENYIFGIDSIEKVPKKIETIFQRAQKLEIKKYQGDIENPLQLIIDQLNN